MLALHRLHLSPASAVKSIPFTSRVWYSHLSPQDEESLSNLKLECDLCRCVVHAVCYGVQQQQHPGGMWLCDVCQVGARGMTWAAACPCLNTQNGGEPGVL